MYIPKNKIITNLYTNGNEFIILNTSLPYSGYYWKTSEGKFFTGKNPEEKPSNELSRIKNIETGIDEFKPQSRIALVDAPTPFINENDGPYNENILLRYSRIKNINTNTPDIKSLPYNISSLPTEEDYNVGIFKRYFCVKINEDIFLELNKEIFDFINSKNPEWLWELYNPFSIPWTIIGNKEEVKKTNQSIVLLQEQRLKRKGFKEFLNNDFTKYLHSE
jgi:hypothetical protein